MLNFWNFRSRAANFFNKIVSTKVMGDLDYLQREIYDWKSSETLEEQRLGQRYYEGEQDIKKAKRTALGADGRLIVIDNLPNNRIVNNLYAKTVDQKVNYILGNPFVIRSGNKVYSEKLNWIFDKHFLQTLGSVARDFLNCGIGWLYVYYDNKGELCFKRFKPYEVLPFWTDEEHKELEKVVRVYPVIVYENNSKIIKEKAEVYTVNGVERYTIENGKLIPDAEEPSSNYVSYTDEKGTQAFNWEKIPIIPFKYNSGEIPLIRGCKELQDCINTTMSDFANRMQEDNRNTILVLKNYDGENLGEFRQNLATYGAVKVRSIDGAEGDVTTLNVEVNAENYKTILAELKKALIENARGFDSKDDRLSGNPNQMNIQSIFNDIDIDSNGIEVEMQSAFDKLLWFVDMHLNNIGEGNFENEDVEITFNRSVMMNESDRINDIKNSQGMLSTETLLSEHPFVDNVEEELEKLANEGTQNIASGFWS